MMFDPLELTDPTLADAAFRGATEPCRHSSAGTVASAPQVSAAPLSSPIRHAGVGDLLAAYASSTLTPTDVVEALGDVIASDPSGAEAVVSSVPGAAELAAQSASRWAAGNPRPLEGIPFGVKDIIDVAGARVTSGSLFTGDRIASRDAPVVARLREAGAIPYAITATTEFATGSPHNPRHGTVCNPWDVTRWTGGSSTGSGAALAARLLPLALGTDTGGSIRVPSCWCGTSGLKPSRELVSRAGVAPLSWTLDHVGPMARSVRDIATVLPHMTDMQDPDLVSACRAVVEHVPAIAGLRIGVPGNWFNEEISGSVERNWRQALGELERAGCTLVELGAINVAPLHEAGWTILLSELAAHHGARMDRADLFDEGLLARLEQGLKIPASAYGTALRTRRHAQDIFLAAMDGVDAIVTPGIGGEAGFLDSLCVDIDGDLRSFQDIISRNTMIFDLTGFPALMLPSGCGEAGLPTGIQIVARPGADILCLRLGAAYQARSDHHRAMPPRLREMP